MVRRFLYRIHFVLASLLGGLAFFVLSAGGVLWVALTPKRLRPLAAVLFARSFSLFMRAILGWRIRVEGGEALAIHPSLILANHQTNLDIVTFGSIYPRQTVVIAKRELAKVPFFGWLLRGTGNLFIERRNAVRAHATLGEAASSVRARNVSVWMFPEGHRNQKPQLLPLKKGPFHLAIAAQAPLVPAIADPSSVVLDAKRLLVRPGVIRIRVLPPIPTDGLTANDVEALSDRTQAAMQEAFDALRATARAPIS